MRKKSPLRLFHASFISCLTATHFYLMSMLSLSSTPSLFCTTCITVIIANAVYFFYLIKWPAEWRASWEAREARKKAREEQAIKGFNNGRGGDDDDDCDGSYNDGSGSGTSGGSSAVQEAEALARRRDEKQAAKASRAAALAEAGKELAKARKQQRLLSVNAEATTQTH